MSLCLDSLPLRLPERSARLRDGAQLTVPREHRSAASALSAHGCPRVELVECTLSSTGCAHRRVCRVHALAPQLPGLRVCRVHASRARLPELRVGPLPRSSRSFLLDERLRESVSRSAERARPPGFPDDVAGPIHGPRSHEARSLPRLPAKSHEPHCTSRPYIEADLLPGFPDKKPTSRMSRPRHEAVAPAPVARCDRADLTARGTALPALLRPTGFPAEKSHTATRCTHTTSSFAAGCPDGEVVSLHRPPALRSVRRCSGCPKHRRRAPGHRLLELRDRAEPPGCPNDPFAAPLRRSVPRGVVSKAVSRLGDFDLAARMPMLEALHFARLPMRSVSSPSSHLDDERVAVRSAHLLVAQG